jgi:archaellum component FlaG (FlaF/FlaG flagellin family)
VRVLADGAVLGTFTANGSTNGGHGFSGTVRFAGATAPGSHQICAYGINAPGTYGSSRTVGCVTHSFNFNPTAGIDTVAQQSPGLKVSGWATDPNTSNPSTVQVSVDGTLRATLVAKAGTGSHPGHGFTSVLSAPNGTHRVCVVALKSTIYSTANSPAVCGSVTLNFNPFGRYESATRVGTSNTFAIKGWAIDPDTTSPISVRIAIDGTVVQTASANVSRTDVAQAYPAYGALHGIATSVTSDQNEHRVCVTALNVGGGTGDTLLGCRIVIAAHPVPPSAPQSVTAQAGYGGAVIRWARPASDGGAPWTGYTITSAPGGIVVKAGPRDTSATLLGLKPSTAYTFTVTATNVAGTSAAGRSNSTTTQASPPPQTTPAPISTSRYVRNISTATTTDLSTMRAEGATDAYYNPSGHGYLILLDIGGQDESRGGVILSASVNFVSYANLVKNIEAYVDGYASKQRPSAPITIAIGTNNDVDVSHTAGVDWADKVVDPVVAYARKYPNIVIAGANDIEPGFSATYTQTRYWLQGYLAATNAPFVFNGSADGCSWTTPGQGCNNGWSMAGLFYLAGGASPTRIINLPQIYNTTMAAQWRYISLTGVNAGSPRINFGGALTEWTACQQAGGCGSLTGNSAWNTMWSQLNADPRLRITSLPYSTDLRIDR